MTAPSAALFWEERWRLWLFAVMAVVIVFVAIGEGGFRPVDCSLLPLAAVAYVARARFPVIPNIVPATVGLVVALVVNMPGTEVEFAMFLPVLGAVMLASYERRRELAVAYLGVSVIIVFVLSAAGVYDWAWINWITALVISWAFGSKVYHYDRAIEELKATRSRMIDQAALVERRRIARDVHDLVGHSLAVVMLHVSGARRLVRTDPDEAESALLQAEQAGRQSMAEIRRTIGLMRDEDGTGAMPAPDLHDVAVVVEQFRQAGLDVGYAPRGTLAAVDGPRAVACYRIAQEALANVTKHTEGATVNVSLDVTDRSCALRVVNQGGRVITTDQTDGHGLIGMRERALSAGGSLIVGPTAGGWSVEAFFPLDPETDDDSLG